jgi:hypothetical protein
VRREVLAADGSLGHPYFRALDRRLQDYERAVDPADVVTAAALADIVYVGDFHALPACQRFAADLLERIAARVDRVALGVEFAYTRQQSALDARQAGRMSDREFLRAIRFQEEWRYDWAAYRDLLDRARASSVPVYALDAPQRRGFGGLDRRDQQTARRIAALAAGPTRTCLVVLYGESHVAAEHLPRRVKRLLKQAGVERREIVVVQNPDRLYWRALERERALPPAVRVDRTTYAVFHTSPLEKYEAYRQVLAGWDSDGPSVQRESGRSAQELGQARRQLARRGVLYEPRANAMFVVRYAPGPVAAESARFLRAALTGRLFIQPDDFSDDPAEAAYGAAYTEALAYLASHLLDAPGAAREPRAEMAGGGRRFGQAIAAHRRFEDSVAPAPPAALLARLGRSRPLRRAIAVSLGRRLGQALVDRLRRGDLGPDELRRLFRRPLDPGHASRTIVRLLRDTLREGAGAPSTRAVR